MRRVSNSGQSAGYIGTHYFGHATFFEKLETFTTADMDKPIAVSA